MDAKGALYLDEKEKPYFKNKKAKQSKLKQAKQTNFYPPSFHVKVTEILMDFVDSPSRCDPDLLQPQVKPLWASAPADSLSPREFRRFAARTARPPERHRPLPPRRNERHPAR